MTNESHNVKIPGAKWEEIKRILKALPHYAQNPSQFVMRAVDHEIERAWDRFKEALRPSSNPDRFVRPRREPG